MKDKIESLQLSAFGIGYFCVLAVASVPIIIGNKINDHFLSQFN